MPYPNPPDWNSSDPLSGWYLTRLSGGTNSCASSGWSLLGSLQSELSGRLSLLGPEPTYDGSNVDASSVPLNDASQPGSAVGWNAAVLRALYAVARAYVVPQEYLTAIQNDAQSGVGPVSPATFQTGAWIADRIDHRFVQGSNTELYGQGSPADIQVPSGSSLPRMDAAPPVPPGGTTYGSVCNALSTEAASLIPVMQTVAPFRFSELLIFGALAVAVGAVVFMSKDIPVTGRGGVRKNPSRRGIRTQSLDGRYIVSLPSHRRDGWNIKVTDLNRAGESWSQGVFATYEAAMREHPVILRSYDPGGSSRF